LEIVVRAGAEGRKFIARGEGSKTGEIETVLALPTIENGQFFAQHLDYSIVTAVQSAYSHDF
jgi:hypothetical protein